MMEPGAAYVCVKCPCSVPPLMVGTKEELEAHIAQYHYGYFPHHCHTCGYRTYVIRAAIESCVASKHRMVFWETREEMDEERVEEDLAECLRRLVPVPEPTPRPIEASEEAFVPAPDRTSHCVESAGNAVTTQVEKVPTKGGGGKPRFKRDRNSPIHTAMTCHHTGCGMEIGVRGSTAISEVQKAHIQEHHMETDSIRCPVIGCKRRDVGFDSLNTLAKHIAVSHGGVNSLGANELASFRELQKSLLDVFSELIPMCFPQGSISRDQLSAKKTCHCTKCGKSVTAYLRRLHHAKKGHVEEDHLVDGFEIMCPVERCASTPRVRSYPSLEKLASHIGQSHGGVARLSEKELAVYRELRKAINAIANKLLTECFLPDEE